MTRDLSDDSRALIRDALAEERRPGSAHRDHLRRRVLARAAAGGVVTLVGTGVAKASGHSLLALIASSLGIGFGAGLVLAGTAELVFAPSARSQPEQSVVRAAPAHSVQAASVAESLSDQDPQLSPTKSFELTEQDGAPLGKRRSVESAPSTSASASASPLRAELDLMAQIQGALRDGKGARALELIARYDAQHPSGVLQNERLAAEVFAACRTGDFTRASRASRQFLERDSVSALAARVKNACSATVNGAR